MHSSKHSRFELYSSIIIFILLLVEWIINSWIWIGKASLLNELEKFSYFSLLLLFLMMPYYYFISYRPELKEISDIKENSQIKEISDSVFNFSYSVLIWCFALIIEFSDFNPQTFVIISVLIIIFLGILLFLWGNYTQGLDYALKSLWWPVGNTIWLIVHAYTNFYDLSTAQAILYIIISYFLLSVALTLLVRRRRERKW